MKCNHHFGQKSSFDPVDIVFKKTSEDVYFADAFTQFRFFSAFSKGVVSFSVLFSFSKDINLIASLYQPSLKNSILSQKRQLLDWKDIQIFKFIEI